MMKKNIKRLSLLVCVTAAILTGCQFFASFKDPPKTETVEISGLTMSKVSLAMKVGSMDYVTIKVTPSTAQKECKFTWTYDKEIISCDTSSAWGVTIKAIKEGQTSLKCSYEGYDATCIITVSGFEEGYEQNTEPYIYIQIQQSCKRLPEYRKGFMCHSLAVMLQILTDTLGQ